LFLSKPLCQVFRPIVKNDSQLIFAAVLVSHCDRIKCISEAKFQCVRTSTNASGISLGIHRLRVKSAPQREGYHPRAALRPR
jgi:hypothetical protein